jgi:hypothetical protein
LKSCNSLIFFVGKWDYLLLCRRYCHWWRYIMMWPSAFVGSKAEGSRKSSRFCLREIYLFFNTHFINMNKKWVACSWCHDSDEKVLFGVWEHRLLFQVSCLLGGQGFFFLCVWVAHQWLREGKRGRWHSCQKNKVRFFWCCGSLLGFLVMPPLDVLGSVFIIQQSHSIWETKFQSNSFSF